MCQDDDYPDEPPDAPRKPTRSERRAEAEAYAAVAQQLARSTANGFPEPPFTSELRDAVIFSRRLTKGARPRQIRRVAQLLSQTGPLSAFRAAMDKDSSDHHAPRANERIAETWRTRLVSEGDEALTEFVGLYPAADRRHLRHLSRQARRTPPNSRSKRAATTLFREIRGLASAVETMDAEDETSSASE